MCAIGLNMIKPGEYWIALDASQTIQHINVPALHVSGWYDMFLRGSIGGFLALTARAASDHAKENQYLIAGPWMHIPWGDKIGAADFGPQALLDTDDDSAALVQSLAERFRRIRQRAEDSPFRAGRKRLAQDPCLARAREIRHVSAQRRQSKFAQRRWIAGEAAASPRRAARRVRLRSRSSGARLRVAPPPRPGNSIRPRSNWATIVLVYTSEPLEEPLRVFGTPRVALYCSTSAAHTDFTAKLVRVKPNGAAEFICIGIARSSWLFAESGYAADKIHLWEFDLEPTSCSFAAGERIRLEIASSAFPSVRPQSRERHAFRSRHFLGLETLHAIRFSRQQASQRFVPAGE